MPMYKFTCPRGHVTEQYRVLDKYVERIKCKHRSAYSSIPCGLKAVITISNSLQVHTFKPYVEEHMTSEPIHIESKSQRDELCSKHGVTYDSMKSHKKPDYKSAVEELDYAEVKQALETGRDKDGNKLE